MMECIESINLITVCCTFHLSLARFDFLIITTKYLDCDERNHKTKLGEYHQHIKQKKGTLLSGNSIFKTNPDKGNPTNKSFVTTIQYRKESTLRDT